MATDEQIWHDIFSGGPRISQERGANPGGGDAHLLFGLYFAENCIKMKKKWTERWEAYLSSPPRSANNIV